jgi:hypothetical protein
MEGTAFEEAARQYYSACFGPESERFAHYQAVVDAEESGDYNAVDELREAESEDVLSVEQLAHSIRGNDEWEILLTTGGPAARVRVETNSDRDVRWATFEYADGWNGWFAPDGQDHGLLADWAGALFPMVCSYCVEENGGR